MKKATVGDAQSVQSINDIIIKTPLIDLASIKVNCHVDLGLYSISNEVAVH